MKTELVKKALVNKSDFTSSHALLKSVLLVRIRRF